MNITQALSPELKFLIEFANLGCEPGTHSKSISFTTAIPQCSPQAIAPPITFLSTSRELITQTNLYHFINQAYPDRKPDTDFILRNIQEDMSEHMPASPDLDPSMHTESFLFSDKNSSVWLQTPLSGEAIYLWNETTDRLQDDEIIDFFKDNKGIDYDISTARKLQSISQILLGSKMKSPVSSLLRLLVGEPYIAINYKNENICLSPFGDESNRLLFKHDGTLTQKVCSCGMDFWYNHAGLHSLLSQCSYCGLFYLRPDKYCSPACATRFRYKDRKVNMEEQRIRREKDNCELRRLTRTKIFQCLQNLGLSPEDSKAQYNRLSQRHKLSFKYYKSSKIYKVLKASSHKQ